MITRFGFAALISALLGASVTSAADIAPVYKAAPATPQVYNWSGVYIGGYAGYAWGKSNANGASDCPTGVPFRLGYYCDTTVPVLLANQAAVSNQATGNISSSGSTWGGYTGINWQSGNWVIGAEADLGAFNLGGSRSGSARFPTQTFGFTVGSSVDTDWLFTARGRFGWAVSNLLIYGTGGVAMTRLNLSGTYSDQATLEPIATANGIGAASASSNRVGYVVGGGIEWALTQNWILRGEYLFMDFGSTGVNVRVTNASVAAAGQANNLLTNIDLSAQVLRFGLSYKLDWGKAPVVAKY